MKMPTTYPSKSNHHTKRFGAKESNLKKKANEAIYSRITNPQSTSQRKQSTHRGHLIHNVFGDGPSAITST